MCFVSFLTDLAGVVVVVVAPFVGCDVEVVLEWELEVEVEKGTGTSKGGMTKNPVSKFRRTGMPPFCPISPFSPVSPVFPSRAAASPSSTTKYAIVCALASNIPRRSSSEPVWAPVARIVREACRVVLLARAMPVTVGWWEEGEKRRWVARPLWKEILPGGGWDEWEEGEE